MNKALKKKGKELVDTLEQLTDAYRNLFEWWYKATMSGLEPNVLAETQLDMCLAKAKELYAECYNRKQVSMHIEAKKKQIEMLMYLLKGSKREKFRAFLVSEFTDEDLKELTHANADKLLAFLSKV